MPERYLFALWLLLAAFVVLLDQSTKIAVMSGLGYGDSVSITPFFNLVLVFNTGAAFSLLAGAGGWQHWFFVSLALGVSAWIIWMLYRHARSCSLSVALSLVLGGALGNLADRLRLGAVVDFLDFHWGGWHWPAFNVADAAIVIGVAWLLVAHWGTATEEGSQA